MTMRRSCIGYYLHTRCAEITKVGAPLVECLRSGTPRPTQAHCAKCQRLVDVSELYWVVNPGESPQRVGDK